MEIGQTLNQRYALTAAIGKGAMGTVYRATDAQTGQDVAIKVIARDLALDRDMLERFRREGEALRQLRHPNIVGFVDMFVHEGQHLIVMEYVPGGSLHDVLRQGPLSVERTRRMALELCDALTRAHHLNIIHRDLKPENVLLTADGSPKLTDFGVARLVDEGTRLTGTGAQVGTPFYMSPEAWEGKPLDAQADIWSLGIVLYEMLSGHVPFNGDTVVAVMNKVLNAPLPDLSALRHDVPPGLAQIIQRMLERDKNQRYQSMREVGADLERGYPLIALTTAPGSKSAETRGKAPPALTRAAQTRAIPPAGRRPLWPWIVGGAVIVAVVLLGGLGLGVGWLAFGHGAAAPAASPAPSNALPTSSGTPTAKAPTPAAPTAVLPTAPATIQPASNPKLSVGVILPMSGPNAGFGASARDGVQLAVDEWNAQGGLLGRMILPDVADGQCDAGPAVAAANRLIDQDQVHYLIGEICSKASIPVSAIAESKHVVEISPASSAMPVTLNDDGSTKAYVFRACFVDPFQGTVMANFALGRRLQKAFVFWNQNEDYSRGLANYFVDAFQKGGGTLTGKEAYSSQTQDFSPLLAKVAASQAQVLYVPDFSQSVNLIAQQAKKQGLTVVMMGGDGWEAGDLDLGALDGGYYTTAFSPLAPSDSGKAWVTRYRAQYGHDPDAMAALSYDAANLLFIAIRRTGVDDPVKVKDSLATLQSEGVTGTFDFDAQHNPVKSAVIMQIKDGQRVYAGTVQP